MALNISKMFKNSAKNVGKGILKKIPPIFWFWAAGAIVSIALLLVVASLFLKTDDKGMTGNSSSSSSSSFQAIGWWVPLGSLNTTNVNGKKFAIEDPPQVKVTSYFSEDRESYNHKGLDLVYDIHVEENQQNIVATRSGTVKLAGYEDTMGNFVYIDHEDGFISIYMHMENNSLQVKTGDSVDYGQVLGLMGNTGNSDGQHLHFQIEKGGVPVNPLDYIDINNPRPAQSAEYNTIGSSPALIFVMEGENSALRGYIDGRYSYDYSPYIYNYITKDKKYYLMGNDYYLNCNGNYGFGICFFVEDYYCKSNPTKGQLLNRSNHNGSFQNIAYFKNRGYDVTKKEYQKFYESKIPVDVVDDIKAEIFEEKRKEVKDYAASYGLTLKEYQIDALADIRYQGYFISEILAAYKANGEQCNSNVLNSSGVFSSNKNDGRAYRRWTLFSTGKYLDASGNEIKVTGNKIVSKAKKIHDYMAKNKYYYEVNNTNLLASTFEGSKKYKKVCCATYVSWVLQEVGLLSDSEHTNSSPGLYKLLKSKEWKEISGGISNAKPGDILFYNSEGYSKGHTDIYIGNNKKYNAGYNEAIWSISPEEVSRTPEAILRAPN